MRSSFASILTLQAILLTSDALKVEQRDAKPQVVHLPIQRRHVDNPVERDRRRLQRRSGTIGVELDNLNTLYIADGSLGTPAQELKLHIDTGSSDLWVNTPDSSICTRNGGQFCQKSGVYTANDSSTYNYVNSDFTITYVDQTGAAGDYATDVFKIGDTTVEDLQFGIGYKSSSPEGILGIGYPSNEAQVVRSHQDPYDNLPAKFAASGDIASQAYSLWLNDLDASTGSILFGGVDQAKYHGSLQTLPILKEDGEYREFLIAMTAMGYNNKPNAIFENAKLPVLLDSGSSLTYLPNNVADLLFKATNARYSSQQGAALVNCDMANQDDTINFSFSGVQIQVPLNEMVLEVGSYRGDPVCVLGISKAGSSSLAVLGDTFLRSAYVVYDLENNKISLAQTNFNATGSQIEAISSGPNGVPDAQIVPNAVASASISGSGARNGLPQGLKSNGGDLSGGASHLHDPFTLIKVACASVGVAWFASCFAM